MNGCVFPNARQCTARSKRTGKRCRAPAVNGWNVCRFHGAGGGAPKGERNGAYRHGLYTEEATAERAEVALLLNQSNATINELCKREGQSITRDIDFCL